MKLLARFTISAPLELTWFHDDTQWRVTLWPDARFEQETPKGWSAAVAGEDVLTSGAIKLDAAAWRRYLEFMPAEERAFLARFRFGRLGALQAILHCPSLLQTLSDTPALTAFVTGHAGLRGIPISRWEEIEAIHERSGVFGLLEWLGLPSSRQTLAILRNVADPDVPRCLLEPLRTVLWEPEAIFRLQRLDGITDVQLASVCHALAA